MKFHIVRNGETIKDIMFIYSLSIDEVKEANKHIRDWKKLIPGTKLKIPVITEAIDQDIMDMEPFVEDYYPRKPNNVSVDEAININEEEKEVINNEEEKEVINNEKEKEVTNNEDEKTVDNKNLDNLENFNNFYARTEETKLENEKILSNEEKLSNKKKEVTPPNVIYVPVYYYIPYYPNYNYYLNNNKNKN